MMKGLNAHTRYFAGVALALIIVGAGIFAFGCVQWLYNTLSGFDFAMPSVKIIGGLVILALGYIHLELELIRTK